MCALKGELQQAWWFKQKNKSRIGGALNPIETKK